MFRYDRTEAAPKPVRTIVSDDPRPVRIVRDPKGGVHFFHAVSGDVLTRSEAIDLMRAYKAQKGHRASEAVSKPSRKAPKAQTWKVEVYRTSFATRKSERIASEKASTFLGAATKLAALCMQHVSDKNSAVEVLIEQVA